MTLRRAVCISAYEIGIKLSTHLPHWKWTAARQKIQEALTWSCLFLSRLGQLWACMAKVCALLCWSTALGAQERVKLKVVFKGGKFTQDFAAGRITTPCFHACSGWCFHTSHPQHWHLSSEMHNLSLWYSVSRKHLLTLLFAPLPRLCLCDLLHPVFEKAFPPLLSLFYLWTILYLHGDTIMWIIKWNAGSAFSAEVSEAESICSSWETAQMYLFSFFAWENWTLHFLLHEKAPHNDYFDGSFPIHSGLFFFSEFILKSGQNLFKMLYLSVNCILTKRRERATTFYFTKNFSGVSWKGIGNGFQDHQSGVSVQTYTGHFIRVL